MTKHLLKHKQESKQRKDELGEVFTPLPLVDEILNKFPDDVWIPSKTFLDPSCGAGAFLVRVLSYKIWLGSTIEQALSTTYGVDIMIDNVRHTKERLLIYAFKSLSWESDEVLFHLSVQEEQAIKRNPEFIEFAKQYKDILDKNIVCHDALTYHYNFDEIIDTTDHEAILEETVINEVVMEEPIPTEPTPTIIVKTKKEPKPKTTKESVPETLEDKIDKLQQQMDLVKHDYKTWSTLKHKQDKLKSQR